MKAYTHNIHLNEKATPNTTQDINLIKSNKINFKELNYELSFNNNQKREVSLYSNKNIFSNKKDQCWVFVVKDIVSFKWVSKSNNIKYHLEDKIEQSLLKYWLLHTLLPIYLTIEKDYYFLHSSCIKLTKNAILFLGNSHSGKSTISEFFINKNHEFLSDDKVALIFEENKVYALPSYANCRAYRKEEDLGNKIKNYFNKKIEIKKLYLLHKVLPVNEVKIKKIEQLEKIKILRHSSDIDLPINKEKRFKQLSILGNTTLLYKLDIPWDIKRLQDVYDTIIKHNKEKD